MSSEPFIYQHNAKTAGYSVAVCLKDKPNIRAYPEHAYISKIRTDYPTNPIVSAVRNPFSRTWSLWNWLSPPSRYAVLPSDLSFEDFVYSYDDWEYDQGNCPVFKRCWDFVTIDDKIESHTILKFENIKKEFDQFCVDNNIDAVLPWENKNPNKRNVPKEEIYNDKMISFMNDYFAKDLETWDYSYDNWLNSNLPG